MNKLLAVVIFLAPLSVSADLKEKYKQQQGLQSEIATPSISRGMRAIQADIKTTWDAIRKEGVFYVIMPGELGEVSRYGQTTIRRSQNFSLINGRRVAYKDLMRDMLVVAEANGNVFMPLSKSFSGKERTSIWKGQQFQCSRWVNYAAPSPLAKVGSDGFASFKADYRYRLEIPTKKYNKVEFEVNFKTKECYAARGGGKVQQCHVVSFKDFTTETKNRHTNVNARNWTNAIYKGLYLRDKNLEYCSTSGGAGS